MTASPPVGCFAHLASVIRAWDAKHGVMAELSAVAPSLSVKLKTSDAFHDRFWIDPLAAKGFITGTSLNGLGKRYALVDHLQQTDAADVIAALRNEGLL